MRGNRINWKTGKLIIKKKFEVIKTDKGEKPANDIHFEKYFE